MVLGVQSSATRNVEAMVVWVEDEESYRRESIEGIGKEGCFWTSYIISHGGHVSLRFSFRQTFGGQFNTSMLSQLMIEISLNAFEMLNLMGRRSML